MLCAVLCCAAAAIPSPPNTETHTRAAQPTNTTTKNNRVARAGAAAAPRARHHQRREPRGARALDVRGRDRRRGARRRVSLFVFVVGDGIVVLCCACVVCVSGGGLDVLAASPQHPTSPNKHHHPNSALSHFIPSPPLPSPHQISKNSPAPEKPEKEVTAEIQAIVRQITASVTFLPLLEDACEFFWGFLWVLLSQSLVCGFSAVHVAGLMMAAR